VRGEKVVVRIPVVTPACITFPPGNAFLLLVTRRVDLPRDDADRVDLAGFAGKVWAPMSRLNRGVVRVIEPKGDPAQYVLLWDGDTGSDTPDTLIPTLF
jgi:hypothetical protein